MISQKYISKLSNRLSMNNDFRITETVIEKKCEFRNMHLGDIINNLEFKESRLRKTWNLRLGKQILSLPEFESVYRYVKREIRQTGWS